MSEVRMKLCANVVLLLLIFSFATATKYYDKTCKRNFKFPLCWYDSWGFNEITCKCYPIKAGYGQCGNFRSQRGCLDFCIQDKYKQLKTESKSATRCVYKIKSTYWKELEIKYGIKKN
ncbi:uncharacterized protein LOC132790899 [Drosophila nasuta]|uniref:uncharacterized protein LOC132790899 n=1 Tax=Drosophila nasuta TaxID=42062 RepID=UPI00295EF512|nr:uncharacterized protein LOC132790899 [Drosophila nasuta]